MMINEPELIAVSANAMCLQHSIEGTIWRFYYKKVDQQWVRYCRINLSALH